MNAPLPLTDLPERDPSLPRFAWAAAVLAALLAAGWLVGAPSRLSGNLEVAAEKAASVQAGPAVEPLGATVFLNQGCGACHASASTSTALGPGLGGVAARAAARVVAPDYTGDAGAARDYLREAIVDHCADTVPGYACVPLPEIGLRLSTVEAGELVDFLMRLTPEGSP